VTTRVMRQLAGRRWCNHAQSDQVLDDHAEDVASAFHEQRRPSRGDTIAPLVFFFLIKPARSRMVRKRTGG
jgi:hypothetical protein